MAKHGIRKSLLLVAGIILLFGILTKTPIANSLDWSHKPKSESQATAESLATLQSQLTSTFSSYPDDTVAMCLINLNTNKVNDFGLTGTMIGASTTKVIVAADYLNQVQEGNATLTQSIDDDDDGSAESLLQTMIEESNVTDSDNAWQDFINYLTPNQITDYAQSIGLDAFNAGTNMITAKDEAIIFQKLYERELLNKTDTDLLLNYLENGDGQDLIPAGLPSGAVIYHKYGYLYGYLNDAGVVTYKGKAFVLSIYTNNSSGNLDDNSSREQLFHTITHEVVKYEA